MKRNILKLLLPLMLISFAGKAQSVLGIGQISYYTGNDTVPAFFTDSIGYWVINYGSSTINDYISAYTHVQDSTGTSFHPVDTSGTSFPVTIAPGDSVYISDYVYYNMDLTTRYHYEINVIVIWPFTVTGTTTVVDSLHLTKYILLPLSVDEIDLDEIIRSYPNPALQEIRIESNGKNSIEEVRISDSQGKVITVLGKPEIICVESWPPGVYFLSVLLENKQRHTIRIVKQ